MIHQASIEWFTYLLNFAHTGVKPVVTTCLECLEERFHWVTLGRCENLVIHMDQNDALLVSSQAWTLSTELVIEFLGEVL